MNKWDKRFIDLSKQIALWSSCMRRKVGAVIVRDKRILTTGYNGAPAGLETCVERNECMRIQKGIPHGCRQEECYAVHAEQNAIIQAAKLGLSVDGATLYCTHCPCTICAKMIINAGISRIVCAYDYPDDFAKELLKQANISLEINKLNTLEEL